MKEALELKEKVTFLNDEYVAFSTKTVNRMADYDTNLAELNKITNLKELEFRLTEVAEKKIQ
jgi:hypothetical protein